VYINKSPSKTLFRHRIHSLLKRADARRSADIIYRIWCMSLVCGSGIVIGVKIRSLVLQYMSISSIAAGRWKHETLGCLNTTSLVLLEFIIRPFAAAHCFIWLNSLFKSTSVCSGTNRVVLSTYLKISFYSDIVRRSLFITKYKVGPMPEPWTILRPMLALSDKAPLEWIQNTTCNHAK